jgi:hypothetical protein
MNSNNDFKNIRSVLSKAIENNTMESVRQFIEEVLSEISRKIDGQVKCPECAGSLIVSKEQPYKIQLLQCSHCLYQGIYYSGTCRTSRSSRIGSKIFDLKHLTIRSIDDSGYERVINLSLSDEDASGIELKSKDKFFLLVSISKSGSNRHKSVFYNHTIGKSEQINSVTQSYFIQQFS